MKRHLMAFLTATSAFVALLAIAGGEYAHAFGGSRQAIVTPASPLGQRLGRERIAKGMAVVTGTPRIATTGSTFTYHRPPTTKRYFLTDLGTLGGAQSFAYALNDAGTVVGQSSIAGDVANHSFVYRKGQMVDLSPLNSQDLQTVGPTGINDYGQIASGVIQQGVYLPALFDRPTGDISVLGSLGGVTSYGFNGAATAINNLGEATGYSYVDGANRHAFIYRNNKLQDLGSFGGYSMGSAINDEGMVAGASANAVDGTANAFLYANGQMKNLYPAAESYAEAVNDFGLTVGQFLTPDQSAFNAFLYLAGFFVDLGFPGDALAINDRAQIVGYMALSNSDQHAILYDTGALLDLNNLIPKGRGWELTWAFDINNHGAIAGYGVVNGNYRAYLLTPAVSADQCYDGGWKTFGFKNQGQCERFVDRCD